MAVSLCDGIYCFVLWLCTRSYRCRARRFAFVVPASVAIILSVHSLVSGFVWIGNSSNRAIGNHDGGKLTGRALAASVVDQAEASNVATWKKREQQTLAEAWSKVESTSRTSSWNKIWRNHVVDKDFYNSDEKFLDALLPRIPEDSRVLQLGVGRSTIAEGLIKSSRVASVLSTDISSELVAEHRKRYPVDKWPGLAFATMDSWNMKFSKKRRFDVVVEKAGIFDIHREHTGLIQRLLACIVTEAFEPLRGGSLIVLARVREPPNSFPEGLLGALRVRPEFNCRLEEEFPIEPPDFMNGDWELRVLAISCGGVSWEVARQSCDAVWNQAHV